MTATAGSPRGRGARSVTVIDTYEPPAGTRTREIAPWPQAPKRLHTTYALDEGGERLWERTAVELIGVDGRVAAVVGARAGPAPRYAPLPGTEFELPADLVLIAIGFAGVERSPAIEQLGLRLDARGNIHAPTFATSSAGVFAAGDARRGQSLVVWAIAEGRRCARMAQHHLSQMS